MTSVIQTGEYAERGDYHKHLDPNWSYYPVYIRKMAWVKRFMQERVPKSWRILDAGCGEGVLVEEFAAVGYKVFGVDLHYGSPFVHCGDVCHFPYAAATFDLVLYLDLIEHLNLLDQESAIREISRILKPRGLAVFAIPNLAHLESRWNFLRRGRLVRTSNIRKHPGDRPTEEYLDLIRAAGLELTERHGIKMTLPKRIRDWLGDSLSERIMYATSVPPSLCLLNILVCRKAEGG